MRFLAKRIDSAEVVDPEQISTLKIQFGALVSVENEDGGSKDYFIVGVDETDSQKSYISWRSPIGNALIGKEVDDEVFVRTPGGEVSLVITKILYKKIPMEDWKCV